MKENFKFAQETGYYLPFMCVWGVGGGGWGVSNATLT